MLSAILGKQFFYDCYNPVGEVMDMMALINSAANYILYCLMSSDFRQTLRKLCGGNNKSARTTVTITAKYEVEWKPTFHIHHSSYLLGISGQEEIFDGQGLSASFDDH